MKISRKIKIGLAFILVSFTVFFAFSNTKIKAADSNGLLTYHYSVYTPETWAEWMANDTGFIIKRL